MSNKTKVGLGIPDWAYQQMLADQIGAARQEAARPRPTKVKCDVCGGRIHINLANGQISCNRCGRPY